MPPKVRLTERFYGSAEPGLRFTNCNRYMYTEITNKYCFSGGACQFAGSFCIFAGEVIHTMELEAARIYAVCLESREG